MLERLIKRKLLNNFKHAYVDVFSPGNKARSTSLSCTPWKSWPSAVPPWITRGVRETCRRQDS